MAPSNKTMLFACLLVAAMAVVAPIAQGHILTNIISISGTMFCSVNGNAIVGTLATPVFPNATVLLRCGAGNASVASGQTNSQGRFSILLNGDFFTLDLSGCRVVVTTPLASCNATLPSSGILTAPLTSVRTIISGVLNILCVALGPFIFSIV